MGVGHYQAVVAIGIVYTTRHEGNSQAFEQFDKIVPQEIDASICWETNRKKQQLDAGAQRRRGWWGQSRAGSKGLQKQWCRRSLGFCGFFCVVRKYEIGNRVAVETEGFQQLGEAESLGSVSAFTKRVVVCCASWICSDSRCRRRVVWIQRQDLLIEW